MTAQSSTAQLTITASPSKSVQSSSLLSVVSGPDVYPTSINLRYLGSGPSDQTNNIATKQYADTYFQINSLVDQGWIEDQANDLVGNLLLQANVDSQINGLDTSGNRIYPKLSNLSDTLSLYPNSNSLGAANGLAVADSSGSVPLAQIPTTGANAISLDNKAVFYNCLTQPSSMVYLSTTYTASNTNNSFSSEPVTNGGNRAATVTLPDPGFTYCAMNFVYVQGKSSGSITQQRLVGTSNMGLITVAAAPAPGQIPTAIFSQGVCMPTPYQNWNVALPNANRWAASPPVKAQASLVIKGSLTLNLYLSNYQGTGYTFYPQGLMWYVILLPTKTTIVTA